MFSDLPILLRALDGAPSSDVLIYDEADFREGGRDISNGDSRATRSLTEKPRITSLSRTSVWFQPRPSTPMANALQFRSLRSSLNLRATTAI